MRAEMRVMRLTRSQRMVIKGALECYRAIILDEIASQGSPTEDTKIELDDIDALLARLAALEKVGDR